MNEVPDGARWGDNFRRISVDDLLLEDEILKCWPIALRSPRIPTVSCEIGDAPGYSMAYGPWSVEETLDLIRLYSSKSVDADDLRAHFKRTITEVYRKAAKLGLRRPWS